MNSEDYLLIIATHLEKSYNLSQDKIDELLPRFTSKLNDHFQNLENEINLNNPTAIVVASHTLKGALLNLGLNDLAQYAWILEKGYSTNDDSINYGEVFISLKNKIESFL